MPHPLARLIPDSNIFSQPALRARLATNALAAAYDYKPEGDTSLLGAGSQFVGCFSGGDEMPDWAKRVREYDRSDFYDNTPGTKKRFSDIASELTDDGAGKALPNFRYALEQWQAAGQPGPKPYTAQQDYGSCFPPGVLIRMADGSSRPIEELRLREQVVTAEGRTGQVTTIFVRDVDEPIYRIKLWGHYGLRLTSEHPILTARGYVKASEILIGDEVALPKYAPSDRCAIIQTADHSQRMSSAYAKNYRKTSTRSVAARGGVRSGERRTIMVCNPVPDMLVLNSQLGRLIGLFLAEGNTDSGKVCWTFNASERETLVEETVSLIRDLFGIEANVRHPRPNAIKVLLHSTPFAQVFDSLCGKGSGGKRLHVDLASGPDEFRKAMLFGWLAGDGYDRGKNVLQGVTISKRLAMDMFSIAASLGLSPSIRYGEPKPSHTVKTRQPRFDVYILKEDRGGSWQSRHDEQHTWRKVRGIEQEHYSGPVYNFSVEGDQSYVADEIGVHNCVDASTTELITSLEGWRAQQPSIGEKFHRSVAWYYYADRGYCSDGWDCFSLAAVALRSGVAFREAYSVGGNSVDFTDDDKNEQIVARTWCRSGIPSWIKQVTNAEHPWEDGGITEFDGDVNGIRAVFAAGGALNTGGTNTSGSSKPFSIGRVGGHEQSIVGCDDSDEFRKFCKDVIGVTARDNDFPVIFNQTWGEGFGGECADKYWPVWWGPKPQGAWVWWASDVLRYFRGDIVCFLPRFKGFPGDAPPVPPPNPTPAVVKGSLWAEQLGTIIAIRGEIEIPDGSRHIAVPDGTGKYKFIPRPIA